MRYILLPALLLIMASCASVDRSGRISGADLQRGISTKANLIDHIGLPNTIETRNGFEYWMYHGKPGSSSFFVPLPVAAVPTAESTTTVYYTSIQPTLTTKSPPNLVCVLDSNGLLVEFFNPRQSKRNK